MNSLCYIPVCRQILSTEWVDHTRYIQQSSTGVRHTHTRYMYTCVEKSTLRVSQKKRHIYIENQYIFKI